MEKDGGERKVRANMGQSLLEVAHQNEIDLEGEAGEGIFSLPAMDSHALTMPKYYIIRVEGDWLLHVHTSGSWERYTAHRLHEFQ